MAVNSPDTVNPWVSRIDRAVKAKQAWEAKFDCKRLVDYYENFQWKARTDGPQMNYRPYTLNLFYSTIQIKLASFLFQRPEFTVTPEPGHAHWDLEFAVNNATIKQDFLNTVIKNRNLKFARQLKLAAIDSFSRFGLMEVGYAADWRNPLKDDPYLTSWDDPDVNEDKVRVKNQNEVPFNERMYVKRIKPERFVVSVSDAEELEDHEWVGYWQYYYKQTLDKTPGVKIPLDFQGSNYNAEDIGSFSKDRQTALWLPSQLLSNNPLVKCWHIWDLVSKKRKLILDDYNDAGAVIWEDSFERLPLLDMRWVFRGNGFYPIPPSWYWIGPQDEINESREQIRSYRRRFTRKFQTLKGFVAEEEKEKFASGPDGVLIEVKQLDAIKAIDNPEIGPTSENALIQAKDDFNIVSATSVEARGQDADRQTATSAQLTAQRAQIRESVEQMDFANFVCEVGREILVQAKEKLTEGMWVKMTSGPGQGMLEDMKVNAPVFKYITSQDLDDGYDFEIAVDVKNATPAAAQAEQQAFTTFVTLLNQFPMLSLSPVLIRETAYRSGYKNEQVIHQMQQAAVLSMAMKAQQAGASPQQITQAAAGSPASGQNANNTAQAQMAAPNTNQIQEQLQQQLK